MKITWFAIDCNLYTHPKMLKLSAALKTDVDTLVGKLGRLWAWAKLSGNEDGDISALPAQEIADIMRWKKSAPALLAALADCGFLDAEETGNFLHGWAELNGNMTAKKRKDSERKIRGNSAENPRKKSGASEEIPGTQYSTVQDKEISPEGDTKKAAPASADPAWARVAGFLVDHIDQRPSPRCLGDLRGYLRDFGPEICVRVMEEAMDSGQSTRNWKYVDQIFKRLYAEHIQTLDDWNRSQARRKAQKQGGGDGYDVEWK